MTEETSKIWNGNMELSKYGILGGCFKYWVKRQNDKEVHLWADEDRNFLKQLNI